MSIALPSDEAILFRALLSCRGLDADTRVAPSDYFNHRAR
jgi:hypothetical protein